MRFLDILVVFRQDIGQIRARSFGSYSHSGIPGFHSGYSAPRSRIAGIYSRIHSYSGIFPNERALRDMNFDLNKSEFRDAVKMRYDWDVPHMPSVFVCGDHFSVDHAMICKRSGFVIQRHNELRDLEAEMLHMVCNGVEIETVLQDITGEELNTGSQHRTTCAIGYCSKGILGEAEVGFFRCENLPPKYRLLQGYGSKPDLQATRN